MSLTDFSKENFYSRDKSEKLPPTRLALSNLSNSTLVSIRNIIKSGPSDYSSDILETLLKEEQLYRMSPNFLSTQVDISIKMRSILVDWLVSVHRRFKLMPETLFLTIRIIDRCLSMQVVQRKELQLVGVASLFIASKYEEIYPPELNDLILLTDRAYNKDQVLAMEADILRTLDFIVTFPSSWRFLERFAEGVPDDCMSLAHYLLELCLMDAAMVKYFDSLLAATAVYVSLKILGKAGKSNVIYSEQEIKPCAIDMLVLFQIAESYPLVAVKEKFSRPAFHQVSTLSME
jgi:cyclin B